MGAVIRVLRFIAARAFGDPVREGRLAENPAYPWPKGLRPLVVCVVGLFVVLTGLIAASEVLRVTPLLANRTFSLPWLAVPFLVLAIAVALALLFTAALHLWWVWRIPLLALVLLGVLGAPRTDEIQWLIATVVGMVVLVVVAVVRWRSRFSVWEFVIACAVIGNLLLVQLAGPVVRAVDVLAWPLVVVTYWTNLLTYLATPAILLAAAAMTELVVRTGSWTARGVWEGVMVRRAGRVLGAIALAVLVVWSVAQEAWGLATDPTRPVRELPVAAVILVGVGLVAFGVLRLAPRGERPGVPVDPDDVADAYSPVSWPLALVLAVWLALPLVLSVILPWRLPDVHRLIDAVILAGVCLPFAVYLARRNRPGQALIAAVFAAMQLVVQIMLALGFATADTHLITVTVVAAVLVLGWLGLRGRLTADRALALATVLLLTRLYEFRDALDDPVSALLALSGVSGVLVVGLLWRQLTEYGLARGHSDRFPNPGRVMLALANMTLVSLSIATFSLSAGHTAATSPDLFGSIGDSNLGGALLIASVMAGLLLALGGREGGDLVARGVPAETPGRAAGPPPGWASPAASPPHRPPGPPASVPPPRAPQGVPPQWAPPSGAPSGPLPGWAPPSGSAPGQPSGPLAGWAPPSGSAPGHASGPAPGWAPPSGSAPGHASGLPPGQPPGPPLGWEPPSASAPGHAAGPPLGPPPGWTPPSASAPGHASGLPPGQPLGPPPDQPPGSPPRRPPPTRPPAI